MTIKRKLGTMLLSLIISTLLFVGITYAQNNAETHETPFGPVQVFELRRENEPNLICYGQNNVLVGCTLR